MKGFINGEVNATMLEINLKFILELTNNDNFMQWVKNLKFDLFKIMKNNKQVSHITNDIMILANKIHHNLLKNYSYSAKFMFNNQKVDSTMGFVLDLETSGITYLKNIVLLSYIKPRSLGPRITNFLMKCKTILIKEIEKVDFQDKELKTSNNEDDSKQIEIDWKSMTEIWELLRKFCTNIFKSENEDIIYQILDPKLAECTMHYI